MSYDNQGDNWNNDPNNLGDQGFQGRDQGFGGGQDFQGQGGFGGPGGQDQGFGGGQGFQEQGFQEQGFQEQGFQDQGGYGGDNFQGGGRPSLGQRIKGEVTEISGKLTDNPEKIERGEAEKHGW